MTENQQSGVSFYPDIIPRHPDHPLKSDFEVTETGDARGRAMIARISAPADGLIAQLSGVLAAGATLNTIQIKPELHMSDPWFCRFLLHSCDPNACIDVAAMTLTARRTISSGDVVTIDYGTTEDRLERQFECHCGARNCRHWMMGRRETANAEGRGVLAAYER